MQKKRFEIEELKRKIQKSENMIHKIEQRSIQLKSSFGNLKVRQPFLHHPSQLIGKDKDRNNYYYFSDDLITIYCHEYNDNRSSSSRFYMYRGEEQISILLSALNRNGRRENSLHNNIKNIMKEHGIDIGDNKKNNVIPSTSTKHNDIHEELDEKIEDTLERVKDYRSIYQPQEDYINNKSRMNRNMYLLEIYRDRIHNTPITERSTCSFIMQLLLDIEEDFTTYLRSRKCRWIDKNSREILRRDALENMNESKVGEMLVMMNSRFIHIETFLKKDGDNNNEDNSENEDNDVYIKKRKNKLWKNDKDNSDENNDDNDDFETDTNSYYTKRKVLKTWGFYNEKFKQSWEQYVSNVNSNHIGALYLGVTIFLEIICRYISRKHMKNEEENNEKEPTINKSNSNNNEYKFRKRQSDSKLDANEISSIEKFNLRVRNRLDREKKLEKIEGDPYDDIDDYSPDRLKTIRNTRALTKRLNKHS